MSNVADYFQKIQLGDCITELSKSTLPASAAIDNGKYPFICSSPEIKYTDTYLQETPAVVMGTGGVASVHFGINQFAYSTDTWAFRSHCENVVTEFLFRKTQQLLPLIDFVAFEGSGLRHLRKDYVRKMIIDVPVEPGVSERILHILRTIDQSIERTEALVNKYQQIKSGLMHDLFTRGIGADGQLRPPRDQAPELYHETPIGWIPKAWGTPLLDNVARRSSGHTPSQSHPEYWNGEIRWLSLADSWRLDKFHVAETEKNISTLGLANSSAVLLPAGTVVITRDGSRLGKSAILQVDMAVSQHFIAWYCGPELHNIFLYWTMQHRKREFENVATGSTIPTIGLAFFKKFQVACPEEVDEQRRIGQVLTRCHDQVVCYERDLEMLNKLRAGLMHDLLTGERTVKVSEVETACV